VGNYPKLIFDLETALNIERALHQKAAADHCEAINRLESLETAFNLERMLSEQRNRTIGELGEQLETQRQLNFRITDGYEDRLATITAERDELGENLQSADAAYREALTKIDSLSMQIPSGDFILVSDTGEVHHKDYGMVLFATHDAVRAIEPPGISNIAHLRASLAAVSAERDGLKIRLTAMADRWKTMIGRTPNDYAAGMQTAYDTAADLLIEALASPTQGETK
jgi:hypothetical protein